MIKITKIDEFRPLPQDNKKRTAAYCRVSTDSDEQMESLDTQRSHYERYIKTNPGWDLRKPPDLNVCIYFEKENLNTGSMESELMLSVLGSLAENESVSISENEKWSIKKRFQNGTYVISYPPYGYTNVDRKMVIVPEQPEIVRQIFSD